MAATTPLSIKSIREYSAVHIPHVQLSEGDSFIWNPSKQTICYNPVAANSTASLLHEVAHAVLEHSDYRSDIMLVQMEAEAWQKAQEIAGELGASIDENVIQADLDTYRDWLHARSTCPECSQNGIQSSQDSYSCGICHTKWHVNEARTCRLRRHIK